MQQNARIIDINHHHKETVKLMLDIYQTSNSYTGYDSLSLRPVCESQRVKTVTQISRVVIDTRKIWKNISF